MRGHVKTHTQTPDTGARIGSIFGVRRPTETRRSNVLSLSFSLLSLSLSLSFSLSLSLVDPMAAQPVILKPQPTLSNALNQPTHAIQQHNIP